MKLGGDDIEVQQLCLGGDDIEVQRLCAHRIMMLWVSPSRRMVSAAASAPPSGIFRGVSPL